MQNIKTIVENTLVPHTAFMDASKQLEQCFRYAEDALEPICLPIIGESRTGKSRSLENFLMNHKRSRSIDGALIPVFSVKTPAKPTVKGLAEQMLRELGDLKFDKGTEQVKTHRLIQLMSECQTRMVIVDEFQHFVDKGSSKIAYHVADWLKTLVDESRVAIVVAGLPTCMQVFYRNEQLAGRFLAPIVLPRFVWAHSEHREEFIAILGAFYEQIAKYFSLPDISSDEMAFRFHCATGGLIGYLAKILRTAIWMAVDQNRHSITLEDFDTAYRMSVDWLVISTDFHNPFSRHFSPKPTAELLELFAKVGTRVEEAISLRGKNRRTENMVAA